MEKIILLLLTILTALTIRSQSFSKSVIGSCGNNLINNIQLSFTLGEPIIATFQSPSEILGQGFHQSALLTTSILESYDNIDVKIYPNPIIEELNIDVHCDKDINTFYFNLFSQNGQLIGPNIKSTNPGKHILSLKDVNSGCYYLLIYSEKRLLKSYKIQKY